jgi:hypothetical protein
MALRRGQNMQDVEDRVAALELLWVEVVATLEPNKLKDAESAIRNALAPMANDDERRVHLAALELIDSARRRFWGATLSPLFEPMQR